MSTQNTYERLAILVMPIECKVPHAYASADGALCICEAGYYRREYDGGWSCQHCDRGHEPVEAGTRCALCIAGKFSSAGEECIRCPVGNEPNQISGGDHCILCDDKSISVQGEECIPCPADQVANSGNATRTQCICPPKHYNSSLYGDQLVQCVAKLPRTAIAPSTCIPCDRLECATCNGMEVLIASGWGHTGSGNMSLTFRCPFQHACVNQGRRCAKGHTGILCAVCEEGYGLTSEECVECKATNQRWYGILTLAGAVAASGLVVYLSCCRDTSLEAAPNDLAMQLTANPLQSDGSPRGSLSQRARSTALRSGNVYILLRVLYQPFRILVGYIQVRQCSVWVLNLWPTTHILHSVQSTLSDLPQFVAGALH